MSLQDALAARGAAKHRTPDADQKRFLIRIKSNLVGLSEKLTSHQEQDYAPRLPALRCLSYDHDHYDYYDMTTSITIRTIIRTTCLRILLTIMLTKILLVYCFYFTVLLLLLPFLLVCL